MCRTQAFCYLGTCHFQTGGGFAFRKWKRIAHHVGQILADSGVSRISYGASPYIDVLKALEQAARSSHREGWEYFLARLGQLLAPAPSE